jgi:hypothetical protein
VNGHEKIKGQSDLLLANEPGQSLAEEMSVHDKPKRNDSDTLVGCLPARHFFPVRHVANVPHKVDVVHNH